MAKRNVDIVDDTIDRYIAARKARGGGIEPRGFRAITLAALARPRVTRGRMSALLQEHRLCPTTRYIVACQGYAANAWWHILATPASDPKAVQEARREQAKWAHRDMWRRLVSDMTYEIHPSLNQTAVDKVVDSLMVLTETQVRAAGEFAQKQLSSA